MARRGRPRHPDILTPREWEVLDLIRRDLSNEGIAARRGISVDGVKFHVLALPSPATKGYRSHWVPVMLPPLLMDERNREPFWGTPEELPIPCNIDELRQVHAAAL
jgi:hypothetical protein